METLINTESIDMLISIAKDDAEMLLVIDDCLLSFCKYHAAIYTMQVWKKTNSYANLSRSDYQDKLIELDKARSLCHNTVISNIRIMNRWSEQNNIELIYSGIVSEERPHRTTLADAVLAYVEDIVKQRNK